jgi:hypothetical protein
MVKSDARRRGHSLATNAYFHMAIRRYALAHHLKSGFSGGCLTSPSRKDADYQERTVSARETRQERTVRPDETRVAEFVSEP